MLQVESRFIAKAKEARDGADLEALLQNALRLEHSTIPPYLTAAFSLKRGSNGEVFATLKEIALEEMLHMAIVANVINAIGGKPDIAGEEFIPKYPGHLPMTIGDLVVGLKKFSRELVHDVFMKIEEPETPLFFPVRILEAAGDEQQFATIGAFYTAIAERIGELGDDIFTGDPARQVTIDHASPWDILKPITNAKAAIDALTWIMEDGEGTPTTPFDGSGQLAHYYRFAEIYNGRRIIEDETAENGYAYGGDPVPIDTEQIWNLPDNPKASDYPEGSQERRGVDRFNQMYSDMLRALQQGFDGQPDQISQALQLMGGLRRLAVQIVSITDPNSDKNVGLTFEYVPPAR